MGRTGPTTTHPILKKKKKKKEKSLLNGCCLYGRAFVEMVRVTYGTQGLRGLYGGDANKYLTLTTSDGYIRRHETIERKKK